MAGEWLLWAGRKDLKGLALRKNIAHGLDTSRIMRHRKKVSSGKPMKRAIRITILMVGLVGTFIAAAVQQVPALDGGPLLLCPPRQPNCSTTLPPQ
jgi:hypothetical protein